MRVFDKKFKNNFKYFLFSLSWNAGRDNKGRICSYRKGSKLYKKNYLFFSKKVFNIKSSINFVVKFIFDFVRNPWNALIYNNIIGFFYIIAPIGLYVNAKLNNFGSIFKSGEVNYIFNIPLNYKIYNINFVYSRSSGCSSLVVSKKSNYFEIKLPSRTIKKFCFESVGFIGIPSFGPKVFHKYFKAGFNKMFGYKSKVRGVAKNPVDHPHGGGEGKKSPPIAAKSP